jgi:NAD(P)-dependent dehydrogenase (short-subunit alcohol dehydrogenase family)
MKNPSVLFDLTGCVAIITGGMGFLGQKHAETISGAGGIPVMVDIHIPSAAEQCTDTWKSRFGAQACALKCDITNPEEVHALLAEVLKSYGHVDILINNAANNPKMENTSEVNFSRLEHFPLAQWQADLAVGLTGSFLCSQVFGAEMAKRKKGVIVNISSDLGVIAPDQRIYRQVGLPEEQQPAKPVTYSVVKHGLIGLTKYLATYWANSGVRVNALSPGGVFNGQPDDFVVRLTNLIPMERMADCDELHGAILFLCSDASSYMTGANLMIDGGRTCW